MSYRLMGLSDEDRLAIEQASGGTIKTDAAKVIVDISTRQVIEEVQTQLNNSLREVQGIVGPQGSVTRLQSGGVNITPGNGVVIYSGGIRKTNIEPDGDLFVGSDLNDPATTSFSVFVNDQNYNGEEFIMGDLLIGDNSLAKPNVKYDAATGKLNFRYGTTVQAYMGADGKIYAGAGDVILDTNGVSIETATSTPASTNAYKFHTGSTELGGMYSAVDTGVTNALVLQAKAVSGIESQISITSASPTGELASLQLTTQVNSVINGQIDMVNSAGSSTITITSNSINLNGATTTNLNFNLKEVSSAPDYAADYARLFYLDTGKLQVRHKQGATETEFTLGAVPYLSAMRVYTADDTWSKPTGLHSIVVEVVGAGGGGGGVDGGSGEAAAAGGGGGGGYSKKRILAATLGATETVTVGAGGAKGAAGNNDGTVGETSSFGAHCQATGGGPGIGQASLATTAAGPGAACGDGGVGSGGDINSNGNSGIRGIRYSNTSAVAGKGGAASMYSGFTNDPGASTADVAGVAGSAYGGGGGGAQATDTATNYAGGDGANGVIIVYEYITL